MLNKYVSIVQPRWHEAKLHQQVLSEMKRSVIRAACCCSVDDGRLVRSCSQAARELDEISAIHGRGSMERRIPATPGASRFRIATHSTSRSTIDPTSPCATT